MNNQEQSSETAIDYAKKICRGIKKKADGNRLQSTFLFITVLAVTVFSPILILMSLGDLYSRFLPAILTACAAFATGWLQLRKPQERWVLYRTAQREIEFEIDQYIYGNGNYEKENDKDAVLAGRVSKRALNLHYEWAPMIPSASELDRLSGKGT